MFPVATAAQVVERMANNLEVKNFISFEFVSASIFKSIVNLNDCFK